MGLARVLAAASISLALGLVCAEAVVRGLDLFPEARELAARPRAEDPREGTANEVHPYLGWSRRPGRISPMAYWTGRIPIFRDAGPTAWARRNWRANTLGYFSEVSDYREVPEDGYVVGIFGGSVADQLAVLGGEALVRALEERFPELAGSVVVLNFGSSGYKQPQQLIALLEMVLLGVPLDLVVNLDGFNELYFGRAAVVAGQHPVRPARGLYLSTVSFLSDPSLPKLELAAQIEAARRAEGRWRGFAADGSPVAASELARALGGALALRHENRRLELEARLREISASDGARDAPIARLPAHCRADADCWDLIAGVWERASQTMDALSSEIGAEYLHVLQPNQYVVDSKPLSPQERAHAWAPGDRATLIPRGYALLRERGSRLQARGVAFRDLTDIYAGHRETLYRDVCCHLNLRGNELLAEAIAAKVER